MTLRHALAALLFPCVLLALLSLDERLAAAPGDAVGVRMLYPPTGAVVTSDPALIMILGPDTARPPEFRLDGGPLELQKVTFAEAWKAMPKKIPIPAGTDDLPLKSPLLDDKSGKAVWLATAELTEGEHAVTLDDATLGRFSSRPPSETDALTSEEPVLRVHASPTTRAEALDCAQCHGAGAADATSVMGVARTPESCHGCHSDVDLSLSHEHVMEFLETCQMCHDPHASTRASLLIDTRETVCGMCHESGYAR